MPESSTSRRIDPLLAVGVAAVVGFAAEIAIATGRDSLPGMPYVLLIGVLTGAAALAVGGVASLLRLGLPVALAVWAGANGGLSWMRENTHYGLLAAGFPVAAWLGLALRGRREPVASGIGVALGLVMAMILFTRLLRLLGIGAPTALARDVAAVLVLAGVVGAYSLYGRLAERSRWLPGETPVALVALVLLIGGAVFGDQVLRGWGGSGPASGVPRAASAAHPNVLILVLDTVRADHLSIYGYERPTTPELERFVARRGNVAVFPMMFSTSNWTAPAHASLFSGRLPSEHGLHTQREQTLMRSLGGGAEIEASEMLAERMKASGYRTGGVFANIQLSLYRGFDRGFDVFLGPPAPRALFFVGEGLRKRLFPWLLADQLVPYPSAQVINATVLELFDGCGNGPCFVVANYMEAHEPLAPAPPGAGRFTREDRGPPPLRIRPGDPPEKIRYALNRYDEEIVTLDAALGELLDELDRRGVFANTWVFITADHGEAYGDHGTYNHESGLYNDEVRVPLLVLPPDGVELTVYADAVNLLDVTATAAAVASGRTLGNGRDLRGPIDADHAVRIEFYSRPPVRAVVLGRDKLIDQERGVELYRLGTDPHERDDQAARHPGEARRLADRLPPIVESPTSAAPKGGAGLSEDEEEKLRALGYLD